MDDSGSVGPRQRSRREFIRLSAGAGTVVWVAPAVVSVSRAAAATSPIPCACQSSATGLGGFGNVLGEAFTLTPAGRTMSDELCVATLGGSGAPVTATAICGRTVSAAGSCGASADVATLDIPVIGLHATLLQSHASASCDCRAPTGAASIGFLSVLGTTVVAVGITPPPNTTIFNAFGVTIVANRQSLNAGALTVDCLVVTLNEPGGNTLALTVAESTAKAAGCDGGGVSPGSTSVSSTTTVAPSTTTTDLGSTTTTGDPAVTTTTGRTTTTSPTTTTRPTTTTTSGSTTTTPTATTAAPTTTGAQEGAGGTGDRSGQAAGSGSTGSSPPAKVSPLSGALSATGANVERLVKAAAAAIGAGAAAVGLTRQRGTEEAPSDGDGEGGSRP